MRYLNRLVRSATTFYQCTSVQSVVPKQSIYLLNQYSPLRNFHNDKISPSESNVKQVSSFSETVIDANSNSSSSESSNSDEGNEEDELHSKILAAALPFVAEFGWTSTAISKGAESLGYSSMVHGMFDKGGVDLVNYFYTHCNSQLENELGNLVEERARNGEKKIKTTEFIRDAVEIRLRMNIDYMDSWAKALVLHASPSNFPKSLHNIGMLVDTIWYHAGDRSYDFNWYTKRGTLAAIYKSTELCMLQDQSNDFKNTWSFLNRRLNEATTFGKCLKQAEEKSKDFGSLMQVGFVTAQNILGLNSKSR